MHIFKLLITAMKFFGLDFSVEKLKKKHFSHVSRNYLLSIIFQLIGIERIFHFVTLTIMIPNLYKIFSSCTFSSAVILMLWHSLRKKKNEIACLLSQIHRLNRLLFEKNDKLKKTCFYLYVKVLFIVLCLLPFVYSFGEMYTMLYFPAIIFYLWSLDKNAMKTKVSLYTRAFFSSAFRYTFCGLVCIFYCTICWEIRQFFLKYRKVFKHILKTNLNSNIIGNNFSVYVYILDLVESFDDIFSHIVFIMVIINSVSVFSLMAICFQVSSNGSGMPPFLILEVSTVLATSATYLTLIITSAAQITIEINQNITFLTKVYQKLKQHHFLNHEMNRNQKLLKRIKNRPVIVLSGCHIIYFSRNLIITIIGTLITYGLLIINFK